MGIEGFSKPTHLQEMHPLLGSTGEFKWLIAIFLIAPIIAYGRKLNESGMSEQIKATNTYARLNLDSRSSQIESKWTI
jgi:hypothetical protein